MKNSPKRKRRERYSDICEEEQKLTQDSQKKRGRKKAKKRENKKDQKQKEMEAELEELDSSFSQKSAAISSGKSFILLIKILFPHFKRLLLFSSKKNFVDLSFSFKEI